MESIVSSLLGKYFEMFIQNFSSDQLNISAMQLKAELQDVLLVNSSIQELLLIPTSMLVTKASCSHLVMQLPKLTEVRKKPIVLSIDKVDVSLEEPDEVPPMPTTLREFFASKKKADPSKKKKEKDDIARGMNYSVKSLCLSLKLKNNPHPLVVEVKDFELSTSTATGEINDDIASCKVVGKDNSETIFKSGKVGSVTVAIGSGADRIVILDGLPAKLKMHNSVTLDLGLPLATVFDVIIEKFGLVLEKKVFMRHYQFMKDLNACLDRYGSVKVDDKKKKLEMEGEKVDFDLQLNDWSIAVLDDKTPQKFAIHGTGLRIGGSPPRGVTNPETKRIEVMSSAVVGMGSMLLEYFPNAADAQGHVLISSNSGTGSSVEVLAETTRVDDTSPPKVAFKFWLNQLCVFLNKTYISTLYNLLNLAKDNEELKMDLAALPEKAKAAKEKLKDKMEFSIDELYQAADAFVEIKNFQIVVPPDENLVEDEHKALSIKALAKKISLKTVPGWSAVPHIADGKALLNAQHHAGDGLPPPVVRPVPGGSKWQLGVEGFDLSIYKGEELVVHVAEPSDVLVYGRFVKNEKCPHVELAVRATRQKLCISPMVEGFFNASWAAYSEWARNLLELGESKVESKESMKDKLAQVKEGMETMEDSALKRVVESAANEDYVGVINESLSAFTGLLYVRFEGGSAQYHENFAQFDSLQLGAEFGASAQSFVVELGAVTCHDLKHESMAVVLNLDPVRRSKTGALSQASSCVTVGLKRPGKDLGVPTIVELGLSNVAVTSVGTKALSPIEVVEELKNYAESRAQAGLSDSAKETVNEVHSKIKEHGKKVLDSLNLHWRFRLGECTFTHRDFDAPETGIARGIATVGAVDWDTLEKKYSDLEEQLITAKMTLVTNEQEKEEMKTNMKVLQDTIVETMKQVEERTEDFVTVNTKLMEERMKLHEMQETIDRLKAQLARAGPPPVNRATK